MTKKLVAILSGGVTSIHFPHKNGNYATLCGMDGDDPDKTVDQMEIELPKNARVDCEDCIALFDVCKKYKESDLCRPPNKQM